jgi:hypothetical protein
MMSDAVISLGIVSGVSLFFIPIGFGSIVYSVRYRCHHIYQYLAFAPDSLRLSLDGVPLDIHLNDIKLLAKKIQVSLIYIMSIFGLSARKKMH